MSGGAYHYPGGWSAGGALERTDTLRLMVEHLERVAGGPNRASYELETMLALGEVLEARWTRLRDLVTTLDRHASGDDGPEDVLDALDKFEQAVRASPLPGDAAAPRMPPRARRATPPPPAPAAPSSSPDKPTVSDEQIEQALDPEGDDT